MSTEEALQEYDRCAKKVFAFRNKKWTTATEKFRATALKEVVQDLVRRRNMGEEMEDSTLEHDSKGQCFVCAMPAKEVAEPSRIRSFSSEYNQFASGIKIWEAARATAAASFYFKPMPLRVGRHITEDFIDAAIGCNNPVEYLHKEAADRIGSGRRLGCLVSIGTGTRIVKIDRAATGLRNIAHLPKFIKELLGTLKNTATDGEDAHRRILAKVNRYSNAYFRFNVPDVADQVRLHEHLKIHSLKATTGTYLSDPLVASQILTVAATLARNLSEHGLTLGHLGEKVPVLFHLPTGSVASTDIEIPDQMASTRIKSSCPHRNPSRLAISAGFLLGEMTSWKDWMLALQFATLGASRAGSFCCMVWGEWARRKRL